MVGWTFPLTAYRSPHVEPDGADGPVGAHDLQRSHLLTAARAGRTGFLVVYDASLTRNGLQLEDSGRQGSGGSQRPKVGGSVVLGDLTL
jgi:hypothetical protein